jgi:predicted acylesterase/phospholipase RssA
MPRTLNNRLADPGPKRILSLDGGGVRGLITLGMLQRVEAILARRSPDPAGFRLCDYFDLIGGTSTGAIIATLLAFGKSVEEVTALYFALCPRVFGRRNLLSYVFASPKFDSGALKSAIEETFDQILTELGRADLLKRQTPLHEEPILGTDLLRTGLALVSLPAGGRRRRPEVPSEP